MLRMRAPSLRRSHCRRSTSHRYKAACTQTPPSVEFSTGAVVLRGPAFGGHLRMTVELSARYAPKGRAPQDDGVKIEARGMQPSPTVNRPLAPHSSAPARYGMFRRGRRVIGRPGETRPRHVDRSDEYGAASAALAAATADAAAARTRRDGRRHRLAHRAGRAAAGVPAGRQLQEFRRRQRSTPIPRC